MKYKDRFISESERSFKNVMKIYNALIELMKYKDIQSISVKSISEKADISRGTFYSNFNNIDDVVRTIESYLISNIPKMADYLKDKNIKTDSLPSVEEIEDCAWEKAFYEYYKRYENYLNTLLGYHGDYSFSNTFKKEIEKQLETRILFDIGHIENEEKRFIKLYSNLFILLTKDLEKDNLDVNAFCSITTTMRTGARCIKIIRDNKKIED